MKNFIIAIDEGTSSVRASLFNIFENKIVMTRKEKFSQIYKNDSWVEQDAEMIFQKVKGCLDDILAKIDPALVLGIGITNQRETTICFNKKTGKPICNAIGWQCRRTAEFVRSFQNTEMGKYIHKTTGLIPDAYFSASKMHWIIKNEPQAKKLSKDKNLLFGTMDSFLIFRLTNKKVFVTDITNASRTMLLDIKTGQWDKKLVSFFGLNENMLPKIVCNDEVVGTYNYFGVEIPIAGICGDQQSSLFGQACFEAGDLKVTHGTGSFLNLNIGNKMILSKNKLVTTIAWKLKNEDIFYSLEGSVFNCGTAVNWLEKIGLTTGPQDCDRKASEVKNSNGAYFVPAFTGLGSPWWEPSAKGVLCGLMLNTTTSHITRAVLEGIAYSVCDVFKVLEKDFKEIKNVIKVDGGVSNSEALMQFESNLLQRKIVRSEESEQTSMGVIYLCGLALGAFKNLEQVQKLYEKSKEYKPKISKTEAEELYEKWKDIVKKAY